MSVLSLSVSVSSSRLALGTKTTRQKQVLQTASGGGALSRNLALGQSMGGGRHWASRGELVSKHIGNLLGVLWLRGIWLFTGFQSLAVE